MDRLSTQLKSLRDFQENPSHRTVGSAGLSGAVLASKVETAWGGSSDPSATDNLHTATGDDMSGSLSQASSDVSAHPDHLSVVTSMSQLYDEGDFVEPKEARKNKRRNSKGKTGSVIGKAAAATIPEPALPSSEARKPPTARHTSLEVTKESFSAPSPCPSLGDFLPMKEEPANSQPLAAWSVDLSKQAEAARSLKEIQEAEKKAREDKERQPRLVQQQLQVSMAKLSNSMPFSTSVWQKPSSPSPSPNLVQTRNVHNSPQPTSKSGNVRSKTGVFEDDDELFWDYEDLRMTAANSRLSPNTERMQDYSRLAAAKRGQMSKGMPAKANEAVSISRQPMLAGANHNNNSSDFPSLSGFAVAASKPAPLKAKLVQANKQLEEMSASTVPQGSMTVPDARAFRQWCEFQIKKLTGRDDMTLVDFCMSLPSIAAAGEYITEYLGSGPAVQAFKAEFLRNKDLITPEVVHTVFPRSEAVIRDDSESLERGNGTRVEVKSKVSEMNKVDEDELDMDRTGQNASGRSGKKKGKKAKKVVDPSLLGFNVTSNRILMGEIQHIDD